MAIQSLCYISYVGNPTSAILTKIESCPVFLEKSNHKLKVKDHIRQKQPSLIVFIKVIILGLHVSTSDGTSSGPHSNIDPDIKMFNALWDPLRSQVKYTL